MPLIHNCYAYIMTFLSAFTFELYSFSFAKSCLVCHRLKVTVADYTGVGCCFKVAFHLFFILDVRNLLVVTYLLTFLLVKCFFM